MEQKPDESKKGILNDKANMFVIYMIGMYLAWKGLSYYLRNSDGFLNHAWLGFIYYLGSLYANISSKTLNLLGEHTTNFYGITIHYLQSNKRVLVEDHCLALPAMLIFTGTVLLLPGNVKNKAWFIPLGLLVMSIVNFFRILLLCVTFEHTSPAFYYVSHSYIYLITEYGLFFIMIIWWTRKYIKPAAVVPPTQ